MLIKNGAVVEDRWITVADDAELSGEWPVIVSLARWRMERDLLTTRNAPVGIRLTSEDALDEIQPDLNHFFLIALDFPTFTDGRPYSTARLLRDRYGFTGELRAVGQVLRDQAQFLVRCGFDAFALRADRNAEEALESLKDFSNCYQAATDQPLPLFRRRA